MPIALLRKDHQTMRQLLTVADTQTAQLADGHIDVEAMNALLDLFKNFIDHSHFAREEHCLQPYLRTVDLAPLRRTMLDEHRSLRRCRRQLAAALLAAEQGEELAIPNILDSLGAFTDGLRQHLDWEDMEVYPRLDQLKEEDLAQLLACFAQIEG